MRHIRDIKARAAALLLALLAVLTMAGCTGGTDAIGFPDDRDALTEPLAPAVTEPADIAIDDMQGPEEPPEDWELPDDPVLGLDAGLAGSGPAPGYDGPPVKEALTADVVIEQDGVQHAFSVPYWDGEHAWTELNGGVPLFDLSDMARTDAFETYSKLDSLGRCGTAYANICRDLQPTEARGEIGSVKPSGWHTVRYNDLISGNYLYNRCHLIGFQLAGENDNERNLVTGTRYLNIDGMLDFENMVDDYVEETGNHVLYRVTPWFTGDELVCRGVTMEAWSVEDGGEGICFFVYAYNVQPGIVIDYLTGESRRADGRAQDDVERESEEGAVQSFVLNTGSGKFHLPDCRYASEISEGNRLEMEQTLGAMLQAGYSPCGACHPDQ